MSMRNRFLLPSAPQFRPTVHNPNGGVGLVQDLSWVYFVVEELIAVGVADIAVVNNSMAHAATSSLPPLLKERVFSVDDDREVERRYTDIVVSIGAEFGIDFSHHGFMGVPGEPEVNDALARMISLYDWMLACRYQLEVSIDLEALRNAVTVLRLRSRSHQNRARLSVISGVLSTYRQQEVDSFLAKPSVQLVNHYERFLESSDFDRLSSGHASLSLVPKVGYGLKEIRRGVRGLLSTSPIQKLVDFTSRTAEIVYQTPTPDSDTIQALLGGSTFPPVVATEDVVGRAVQNFWTCRRKFIPPTKDWVDRGIVVVPWDELPEGRKSVSMMLQGTQLPKLVPGSVEGGQKDA